MSASFTLSPNQVDNKRAKTFYVDLLGNGTSWTSGTTVTISGVSGTSKVSQIFNSATWIRLNLTTSSATGTATVSDGTLSASLTVTTAVPPAFKRSWFPGLSRWRRWR